MSSPKRLACRHGKGKPNIWIEFSTLAKEFAKVDFGQGQPSYAPQSYIAETLSQVALEGNNFLQYTREVGHPRLVKAVADLHGPLLGRAINPTTEVLITHGAYESLFCACLGLVNPGDEVILIEPFFDCYEPMVRMSEGRAVFVPLRPSVTPPTRSEHWKLDPVELEGKFSDKTKLIIFNTPHNPTGKVYNREEMEMIAALCIKYDVICVCDEVYEWVVYPGARHLRMATLPGMWERTITVSSGSKSFGVTGWRVGWSVGPEDLISCLLVVHQSADGVCATPTQEAVARCIEKEIATLNQPESHFCTQREKLLEKRDVCVQLLREAGFVPCVPDAGFFVMADWSSVATEEMVRDGSVSSPDFLFVKWFLKNLGILTIPPSAFYGEENNKHICSRYVRFCFCKTDDNFDKARQILKDIPKLKRIQ